MPNSNITYYDRTAGEYADSAASVDMSHLYGPFLAMVPAGGRILDAGCGAGRDAKVFSDRGYEVDAFDASAGMAEVASELLGKPVAVMRFQDVGCRDRYDGVWACASLLHIPEAELTDAIERLAVAIKPGGVLYASFKYGSGERADGDRVFTDMSERRLREIVDGTGLLAVVKIWETTDSRWGKEAERWVNCLARRTQTR